MHLIGETRINSFAVCCVILRCALSLSRDHYFWRYDSEPITLSRFLESIYLFLDWIWACSSAWYLITLFKLVWHNLLGLLIIGVLFLLLDHLIEPGYSPQSPSLEIYSILLPGCRSACTGLRSDALHTRVRAVLLRRHAGAPEDALPPEIACSLSSVNDGPWLQAVDGWELSHLVSKLTLFDLNRAFPCCRAQKSQRLIHLLFVLLLSHYTLSFMAGNGIEIIKFSTRSFYFPWFEQLCWHAIFPLLLSLNGMCLRLWSLRAALKVGHVNLKSQWALVVDERGDVDLRVWVGVVLLFSN